VINCPFAFDEDEYDVCCWPDWVGDDDEEE
jgi:hypothetical protein